MPTHFSVALRVILERAATFSMYSDKSSWCVANMMKSAAPTGPDYLYCWSFHRDAAGNPSFTLAGKSPITLAGRSIPTITSKNQTRPS